MSVRGSIKQSNVTEQENIAAVSTPHVYVTLVNRSLKMNI